MVRSKIHKLMLIKYDYNNNDIIHKNEAPKSIIKYRGK